jgi:hypothetical protein
MTNQRIIKEFLFDLENTGNSNNLINTGDQLISHDLVIAEKVPTTTVGKFETVIYNWNDSYIPSIIREDIRIVKEQASKLGYWGFRVV